MKINWREAEQLIQEVEAQEIRSIAARQSPLLLLFGIGIVVIGIVLIYSNASFLMSFLLAPHDTISPETALALWSVYYQAGSFLLGVCMLIGGLVGSWRAVARLLRTRVQTNL